MKVQIKKKLVQNFQFNPHDIKTQDGYQVIESKNILLNQLFTLKRFSLDDPGSKAKYDLILRQISILKEISGSCAVKCQKILKNKTHVYVVFDHHTGKNLHQMIQNNLKIIQENPSITPRNTQRLSQEIINMPKIFQIGKQLCQILKQIQSKNIIHRRFCPQNIVLDKNDILKLTNFTNVQFIKNQNQIIFTDFAKEDEFTDPFYIKCHKLGFYTDIYSFGVILRKLYETHQLSKKFLPNHQLDIFIKKLTINNPYERPKLKQIEEFFNDNKKDSEISKKRYQPGLIQKTQRPKEPQAKKIYKSIPYEFSMVRGQYQYTERPQVDKQNAVPSGSKIIQERRKAPETYRYSLSRNNSSGGFFQVQNQLRNQISPESNQEIEDFRSLKNKILLKRNLSVLLLQLANVISNQIQGHNILSLQLTFLLYKKAMVEIVILAKYLSKGSDNYLVDIPEKDRLKFTKTIEYLSLCRIINQQLLQQRNTLTIFSTALKREFSEIFTNGENQQFEKQLKLQAINNEFFLSIIRQFLQSFVEDFLPLNINLINSKTILFYLNILMQASKCLSIEHFFSKHFQPESNSFSSSKLSQNSQKVSHFYDLLNQSPLFFKLKSAKKEQLLKSLIEQFGSGISQGSK